MSGKKDPLLGAEASIRRVYSYAAYWLGDGPDAEDATSQVFENALRYRKSYDANKGEPIAWLMGIARRTVTEAYAMRATASDDVPDRPTDQDLESETVQRITIDAAIATLNERDRELIALRYGADLKARQIGELLEMAPNSVEVALHRALARLRVQLEQPEASEEKTEARVTAKPSREGRM